MSVQRGPEVSVVHSHGHQRGSALVEFAFVLPVLMVLLVGVIYYGYLFTLATAVDHAASEAAQAAVMVQPVAYDSTGAYQAAVTRLVKNRVRQSLDWLPAATPGYKTSVCFACGSDGQDGSRVTVTLDVVGGESPLLPRVTLPVVGSVPPVPDQLQGVAQIAL